MKLFLRCVLVMSTALLLGAAPVAAKELLSKAKSVGRSGTGRSLAKSQTQRMLKWGGKARFSYRFRLSGSDVLNGLRVSNHFKTTGVVRVIANGPGGSSPAKVLRKIAGGDSVVFAPEEMGWLVGNQVLVKVSPGLTASLTSATNSMQLPRVKGVSVYDVFSNDRRAEMTTSGSNTTVIPLTASSSAAANDPSVRSAAAVSSSIWVAFDKALTKKAITK